MRRLIQGEVARISKGEKVSTLLGSCVAILIANRDRTVGTMCHFVHSPPSSSKSTGSAAFGPEALNRMQGLLQQVGVAISDCEAWLYGGGALMPQFRQGPGPGARNAVWAADALRSLGVPVLTQDLGGACYRNVEWMLGESEPKVRVTAV